MTNRLKEILEQAIDFVRAHPYWMSQSHLQHLTDLAEQAYCLAVPLGLHQSFPQVCELQPELEAPLPRPAQYKTKLNLPGDVEIGKEEDIEGEEEKLPAWRFLVCTSPRWIADMATLSRLAEQVAAAPEASTAQVDTLEQALEEAQTPVQSPSSPEQAEPAEPPSAAAEALEGTGIPDKPERRPGGRPPVGLPTGVKGTPAEPRKLLKGWHEITAAVGVGYCDRKSVKSLNERFNGPIKHAGAGTTPMVYRDDLLDWWNKLDILQQELANQREGARLSAEAQFNYGRDGTVAPEIGGGVKKRRKRKDSRPNKRT